jgi:hypothetical protein
MKDYLEKVQAALMALDAAKAKSIVDRWPSQSQKQVFEKTIAQKVKTQQKQETDAKIKEANKGIGEVIQEAFTTTMTYVGRILYITLALLMANFAASEILYKEQPYIILKAIYAFVFAPIFIAYYTYRAIMYYAGNGTKVRMEALILPLFPYADKPQDAVTFLEFLFGYKLSPELTKWIATMKDAETTKRQDYLQTDFLAVFRKEKEEERQKA